MKTISDALPIRVLTVSFLVVCGAHTQLLAQVPPTARPNPTTDGAAPKQNEAPTVEAQPKSKVVRDSVPGSFLSPGNGLLRITGKVKVPNAHTLVFDDGTEVELNGGMDAPELEQKG